MFRQPTCTESRVSLHTMTPHSVPLLKFPYLNDQTRTCYSISMTVDELHSSCTSVRIFWTKSSFLQELSAFPLLVSKLSASFFTLYKERRTKQNPHSTLINYYSPGATNKGHSWFCVFLYYTACPRFASFPQRQIRNIMSSTLFPLLSQWHACFLPSTIILNAPLWNSHKCTERTFCNFLHVYVCEKQFLDWKTYDPHCNTALRISVRMCSPSLCVHN